MVFNILICVFGVGLLLLDISLANDLKLTEQRMINTALKLSELEERIDKVDDSTGIALHELGMKMESFNATYGEAAIEREREAARAEKAWADGLNNIMSFGASLHGRGDST